MPQLVSLAALTAGGLALNIAFWMRIPALAILAGFLFAFAIWKG